MKFAAYSNSNGWIVDLCVGITWSWNFDDALWWDSPEAIDG